MRTLLTKRGRDAALMLQLCLTFGLLYLSGCASEFGAYRGIPNAKTVRPMPEGTSPPEELSFEETSARWTVQFTVPNPLAEAPEITPRSRPRAPETGRIRIWATLYDPEVIDAWIRVRCREDSLSDRECDAFRQEYVSSHRTEEDFRIHLKMESDFAVKSLEPDLWAIYLLDDEDIMYEPRRVRKGEIEERQREIYSPYHRITVTKTQIRRTVDLYFPKVTFFGKALTGGKARFLKLVFSRHRKAEGEGVWIFESEGDQD